MLGDFHLLKHRSEHRKKRRGGGESRGQLSWNQLLKSATFLPRKVTDYHSETTGVQPHTPSYCVREYLFASLKQIRNFNLEETMEGKERERKKGDKTVLQAGILVRTLSSRQVFYKGGARTTKNRNETSLRPCRGEGGSLSCFKSL